MVGTSLCRLLVLGLLWLLLLVLVAAPCMHVPSKVLLLLPPLPAVLLQLPQLQAVLALVLLQLLVALRLWVHGRSISRSVRQHQQCMCGCMTRGCCLCCFLLCCPVLCPPAIPPSFNCCSCCPCAPVGSLRPYQHHTAAAAAAAVYAPPVAAAMLLDDTAGVGCFIAAWNFVRRSVIAAQL
ncbi:hypothetical protein COO60DRAFT_360500 [Scenedesmus sp. NREL 46B-D3]|nr:hypothetical protein COO60DRAFT_360500 [Scenedesmus sp. NREL 46B-D3]